ncbi:MAG: PEP-CTERM sorting domain-containing protein [Microcoleaceae cyanobacterium MO_207.B10]|nr:PEP-CTERM sorting domain-containing protein [Microcoleaceae cyanobacterium MO_207.B10]
MNQIVDRVIGGAIAITLSGVALTIDANPAAAEHLYREIYGLNVNGIKYDVEIFLEGDSQGAGGYGEPFFGNSDLAFDAANKLDSVLGDQLSALDDNYSRGAATVWGQEGGITKTWLATGNGVEALEVSADADIRELENNWFWAHWSKSESQEVPEPTTILASITAGGIGLLAKRHQAKKKSSKS